MTWRAPSRSEASALAARMLEAGGVQPTKLRMAVLASLLQNPGPAPAQDILDAVRASHSINKVTLYRILDLLVEQGLALRHSAGERSFRYCALPQEPHDHGACLHCHFHCTRCGAMQCLDSHDLPLDRARLLQDVPLHVNSVEIRLDGVCAECEKSVPDTP